MALRHSQKNSRSRRLLLESLEHRQVMAGNVVVALSGANLLITGDAADNAITINAVAGIPGRLNIQPGGDLSTTINGKSDPIVLNFPSFSDTRISLAGGDDTLEFIGDAGASDSLLGSLVIDGGTGNNTINISDYDVGANVSIRNGSGSDTVTLTNVHAGNDIIISNGHAADTPQATSLLEGTSSGRDVRISNGDGANTIDLGGAQVVNVGRDLYLSNLGAGLADSVTITLDNVTVTNNVNFTNRPVATINFGGETGGATIARSTTIRNGAGDNLIALSQLSSFGSVASDRFSVTNGAGNNTITFDGVNLNGAIDLRNGAGDTTITAQGNTTFNGSMNITTATSTGSHAITFQDGAVLGNLTIFNGGANDNTISLGTADSLLVTGNTYVVNGNATTNTISVPNATLLGNVTLTNGTGTNVIDFGNAGAGNVLLGPRTAFYNGSGPSATITVEATTTTGSLSIRNTGSTANTVTFGTTGPVATGALSVSLLGGANNVTLDQITVTGNASIQTGGGDDTITIGDAGAAGVSITGKTTLITGAGDDAILIGANAAGGTVALSGFVLVQMGAGVDNCTLGANTSNAVGTAIDSRAFLFDGGADPLGSNTITVSLTVIDPAIDLATFNKFRRFVIVTIP